MEFTTNAKNLLEALTRSTLAVARQSYVERVVSVELKVNKGNITLRTSDLTNQYTELLEGTDLQDGIALISCEQLLGFLKASVVDKNTTITCKALPQSVVVKSSDGVVSNINFIDSEEGLPNVTQSNIVSEMVLDTKDVFKMLDYTKGAISNDETRWYLNGVYLETTIDDYGQKVLRGVTTNGHILALYDIVHDHKDEIQQGLIVTTKCFVALHKILPKSKVDSITIQLTPTDIRFIIGNITIISKPIDGIYPNYKRVIPTDNDDFMEVITGSMYNLVASYKPTVNHFAVTLSVTSDKVDFENCVSSGSVLKIPVVRKQLPITSSFSEEFKIGFNMNYLKLALSKVDSTFTTFYFSSNQSPVVIKGSDSKKSNTLFVVMPMRL